MDFSMVGTCFDRSEIVFCGSDGVVRFFDTSTCQIYSEYVPSKHLFESPRYLTRPVLQIINNSKKRKSTDKTMSLHSLIACATQHDSVLIFNKGELSAVVSTPSHQIVSLHWIQNRLVCVDSNGAVVEIVDGKVSNTWHTSFSSITASISPCGSYILLGKKSGKLALWLMNEKKRVFKFVGHSSAIKQIIILQSLLALTAAEYDLHVGLWRLEDGQRNKSGDGSIPILSPFVSMDASESHLAILTKEDGVLIYALDGDHCKPCSSVRIETCDKKPLTLCAFLTSPTEIIVAYGKVSRPKLKTYDLISLGHELCTIEETTLNYTENESDLLKVKLPELSNASHTILNKRDQKAFGEKLPGSVNSQFSSLLAQGLRSGDNEIMNQVLRCKNPELIRQALEELDVSLVPKFIDALTMRMQGNARFGLLAVMWMKPLLALHSSIISSHSDLLRPLVHLAKYRTRTFFALCNLQGKVELLLNELKKVDDDKIVMRNPLVVIQDKDTSEESESDDAAEKEEDETSSVEEQNGLDNGLNGIFDEIDHLNGLCPGGIDVEMESD